MHCFGVIGSSVPHYEKRILLLETLVDHPKKAVRLWAEKNIITFENEVRKEKERDAERDFCY